MAADMQLFLVVPPLIMVYERNRDRAWKIVKGFFFSSAISRVLVSIFAHMSVCTGAMAGHFYMYTKPFVFFGFMSRGKMLASNYSLFF